MTPGFKPFTVKPIVVHGLFCRHCICLSSLLFEGPPTTSVLRVVQRLEILSLTDRRSILFSGTYLSGRKTPIGHLASHWDWGDHVRVNTWMFQSRELFVLSEKFQSLNLVYGSKL